MPQPPEAYVPLLNEAQRRSLTITLRILEQTLDEPLEAVEEAPESGGILYPTVNDLSFRDRELLLHCTDQVKARIADLCSCFDLSTTERTTRAAALSRLNYCWEILQQIDSTGLAAYGATAAGLVEILDPKVHELNRLVMQLLAALEKKA